MSANNVLNLDVEIMMPVLNKVGRKTDMELKSE